MRIIKKLGLAALVASVTHVSPFGQSLANVPEGFTPIFNGRDTTGWHWSRTTHHGTTARARVENGALILQPHPFGQGGVLLTDKVYKDFELYVEANPDPNYNSGIFLRSTEGASAFQIEIIRPGNTGALLGERQRVSERKFIGPVTDIETVWKENDWNSFRIRMEGEVPHVWLWVNGVKLWELQLPVNDQVAGAYGGMIGLQLHWTAAFTEGARASGGGGRPWLVQRFRNIGIKELNQ
jgi:hypothetical protein